MDLNALPEEQGELMAPLNWVEVTHALLSESVDCEVIAFASQLTGRRFAFLERDATWVLVEPLDDDGNALETATGIAVSSVHETLSSEAAKATWRLNDLLRAEAPVGAPHEAEERA